MAGNGTIGLEIVEQLPDADAILVPFGGGGLVSGIATAIRALRPRAEVYACEVGTSTPLSAALAARGPVVVERTPSFVDGIGGRGVLPEMWPIVSRLVEGALVAPLDRCCDAPCEFSWSELGWLLKALVRRRSPVRSRGGRPVARWFASYLAVTSIRKFSSRF